MRHFFAAVTVLAITLTACDADVAAPIQGACPEQVDDNTTPTVEIPTTPLAKVGCISICRLTVVNEAGFVQQVWDPIDPDINLFEYEFSGEISVEVYAGLIFEIEVLGVTGEGGVYGGAVLVMESPNFMFKYDGLLNGAVHSASFVPITPQPGVIETFEVVHYQR